MRRIIFWFHMGSVAVCYLILAITFLVFAFETVSPSTSWILRHWFPLELLSAGWGFATGLVLMASRRGKRESIALAASTVAAFLALLFVYLPLAILGRAVFLAIMFLYARQHPVDLFPFKLRPGITNMKRTSPLLIAFIVLVGVLVSVEVLFHPLGIFHVFRMDTYFDSRPKAIMLLLEGWPLEEIQKAVAESGKGVDRISWLSGSLLYWAAGYKRMDVAQWLLDQGANPNGIAVEQRRSISDYPRLPLKVAIEKHDLPIVKLLLKAGADPDLRPVDQKSPREYADSLGDREIIAALPPSKQETGMEGKHPHPDKIDQTQKGQSDARGRVSP